MTALVSLAPWLERADAWILVAFGVFIRIGAALFLWPGFGERAVSMRVRLTAALCIAMVLVPVIAPGIAVPDRSVGTLAVILASEATAGLLLGLSFRFLIWGLQTGGTIAAQSMSISQMFGGIGVEPEPTVATFYAISGVAMAMVLGLHVRVVAALADTYNVMPFGVFPVAGDAADWTAARAAQAFDIAISVALPFIILAFLYNLALGVMNRAMPQLMVAFIGVPGITALGIVMLGAAGPATLSMWANALERVALAPFGL